MIIFGINFTREACACRKKGSEQDLPGNHTCLKTVPCEPLSGIDLV